MFFFLYLAVKQDAESFHFPDYLKQLGQCVMVVLLRDVVQPLKVTLVQLQVQVQLCQCGLQLGSKQNNNKKKHHRHA